jgi:hypothetical protein
MSEQSKLVTRQELYEAVWAKPITVLTKEWNTNYTQIAEACALMDVPRPASGHWQSVAHGHLETPEPLPTPGAGAPTEMLFSPGGGRLGGAARAERERIRAQQRLLAGQAVPAPAEEQSPAAAPDDREEKAFDVDKAAERAVLDVIRQPRKIDFWSGTFTACYYVSELRSLLKAGEDVKLPEGRLLKAVKGVRKDFRTFEVKVQDKEEQYGRGVDGFEIEIKLREGCEWREAWEEAWSFAEKRNDHCLSDNALRTYLWAKGPKNTGKTIDQNKIGAQAKLRGTYSYIEDHLREIQLKAEPGIRWQRAKGSGWHGALRIWFEPGGSVYYNYGPLNPGLGLDVSNVTHGELERFRAWLYEEMFKPDFPNGDEWVGVFDLRTRKALKAAFSRLPASCGRYGGLPDFFKAVRLIDGVDLRCSFEDGGGPWLVVCQPHEGISWRALKEKLAAKNADIPLDKKYRLSRDALALLKWILELRTEECSHQMTPPVEDILEKDIGIEAEYVEENTRALIEVLIEEINEQTDFRLRAVPWRKLGDVGTRILVKKKEVSLDRVVRAIQAFGLTQNRLLSSDKVKTTVNGLISGG